MTRMAPEQSRPSASEHALSTRASRPAGADGPFSSPAEAATFNSTEMATQPAPSLALSPGAVVQTGPILVLAVATRLAVLAILFSLFSPSAQIHARTEILAIGLSLAQGHGFSSPFYVPSGPTAFLAPGYPLLVAAVLRLFGFGPAAFVVIVTIQVVFSVLTVWLVLRIAHRHFNAGIANIAGCLCALSLPLATLPFLVWETCLSSFMLLGFFAAVPLLRTRLRWTAAGAAAAATALVNPALIPTLFGLGIWQAWRRRTTPRTAILAFLLLYGLWPARNLAVMHAWIPLRSNFGYELWMGNHASGSGEFIQELNPLENAVERAQFVARGELPFMRWKSDIAIQYIRTHPRQFIGWTAFRIGRFWTAAWPGFVVAALFSGFALLGLAILWRKRPDLRLYAIPLALYPLPYYITHPDGRFRNVIDPLLAILAAYALTQCIDRVQIGIRKSQNRPSLGR